MHCQASGSSLLGSIAHYTTAPPLRHHSHPTRTSPKLYPPQSQLRLAILSKHSSANLPPLHFPSSSLGHDIREPDSPGDLELGHLLPHETLHILLRQFAFVAGLEDDGDADILPVELVVDGEANGFGDGWMSGEGVVELDWGDFFAALLGKVVSGSAGWEMGGGRGKVYLC